MYNIKRACRNAALVGLPSGFVAKNGIILTYRSNGGISVVKCAFAADNNFRQITPKCLCLSKLAKGIIKKRHVSRGSNNGQCAA